jgi:hypothetical protein
VLPVAITVAPLSICASVLIVSTATAAATFTATSPAAPATTPALSTVLPLTATTTTPCRAAIAGVPNGVSCVPFALPLNAGVEIVGTPISTICWIECQSVAVAMPSDRLMATPLIAFAYVVASWIWSGSALSTMTKYTVPDCSPPSAARASP